MLPPSIYIIPPCCFPKHLNLIFEEAISDLKHTDTYTADLTLEPDVYLHKLLPELVYEVPHTTIEFRLRTVPSELTSALLLLSSRRHIPVGAPSTSLINEVTTHRIRKKDSPESLTLSSDLSRRGTPITITLKGELSTPLTPKMRKVTLIISKVCPNQ